MRLSRSYILALISAIFLFSGCSFKKYLPEDELLLSRVKVKSNIQDVPPSTIHTYVQQSPNNYFLGIGRLQLALYSMSGPDSTKWGNRWLRRMGEPPVVFSEESVLQSKDEIEKLLFNNGYLHGQVKVDTVIKQKKRSIQVTYTVSSKEEPYTIKSYSIDIPDSTAMSYINTAPFAGTQFNVDKLEAERVRVTNILRNRGYYNFQKELLYFTIDTAANSQTMDIKLNLQSQYLQNDTAMSIIFAVKKVKDVYIMALKDKRLNNINDPARTFDTVMQKGYTVITEHDYKTFRVGTLIAKTHILPNAIYNERQVERSYSQLHALDAVKHVNISFAERKDGDLDAFIVVSQDKPHSFSAQIEGTYSGGDLGAKLGIGYANNNIFRGAETLNIGASGGYEVMGQLDDITYSKEIGGNASLQFPSLLIPFTSDRFKRRAIGSTEVGVSVNFQQRPEYSRNIANAGFKYNWRWRRTNFTYNLIDISYIYLPRISPDFEGKYLTPSSSIRFSYENQLIMRMGLGITQTNAPLNIANNVRRRSYYTLRANVKTAGNLLYGISNLIGQKPNEDGFYEIFNTQYSQYVKGDVDFSYNVPTSLRNTFVFHFGLGVAFPYGNATILPFEERYYSGGANSVRGWSVRTLGPGSFRNTEGIDFMRQSGDIRLDLNIEGRFKLFWKLEGALFLDAGNIWTIKNYEEQPGGYFQFDQFYKQIGLSYGAGIRLDFSFFVIRLDMGIKLYDPGYASVSDRWRTDLTWKDDVALHFAVGYPF